MKDIICIILCISLCSLSWCQTISYDLSTVPDSIKKNADVVVQYESHVFTIQGIAEAALHVRKIYTVINENGKDELDFQVFTSKYISLADADFKVYDAKGKLISKHKKKEMMTQAMGEGLVEDGFVTFYSINAPAYPLTIDLDYEVQYKGTLFYPSYAILVPNQGVLESSFTARVAPTLDLRYKEKNTSLKPDIKDDGKVKTYTWSTKNLVPIEYEAGAVEFSERFPSIELAPNRFSLYGNNGDLSSWKNYGLWLRQLYNGMDQLSEDRKAFFIELVKGAKDDREKIRLIYDYLQKNFRYVSIQLGIGGFKPFSAVVTDQKKYGDCKALSNYMKAALNAVGIKSNIAIINAGYNSVPVDPDFSVQTFNHVILCVPQTKDSVWLECTSSTADFGVLSTFTENRYALLITDDGGVLVPTPRSSATSNKQSIKTIIELTEDGSGKSATTFQSTGYYKEFIDEILKSKKDEQKEALVLGMSYKQPDEFEFVKKSTSDELIAELKMSLEKVPDFKAGNKLFLSPRIYKIWTRKLPRSEDRKLDYYFRFPFIENDTTIYKLPDGYKPDVLPPAKEVSGDYASYATNYWYDENQKAVYSTINITLKKHIIPAKKYAEVKKVFDDILTNDGQKIVIRKE